MPPQPQSRNKLRADLRTCKRKVKHPTLEYAEKALRETSAKYPDTLLQIYTCLACGFFHLGNELSRADARRGLTKLEKIMVHPNFWTKAPKDVIERFQLVQKKCRKRLGLPETDAAPVDYTHAATIPDQLDQRHVEVDWRVQRFPDHNPSNPPGPAS